MKKKIYKYASLKTGLKILKGKEVLLNNPLNYNDPFDSDFQQDRVDKNKIDELLTTYIAIKVLWKFVNNNISTLKGYDRNKVLQIYQELRALDGILMFDPELTRFPHMEEIIELLGKENFKAKIELNKEKENFQKKINNAIDFAKDHALMTCFSKNKNSILMWSHYADSHKGVCFMYDVPSVHFKDVKYSRQRNNMKLLTLISHLMSLDLTNRIAYIDYKYAEGIMNPFFSKSKEWHYEHEVRYLNIGNNDTIKNKRGKWFYKIGKPKAIYFGCKCDLDSEGEQKILAYAKKNNIKCYIMNKRQDEYKLIPTKI